MVLTLYYVICCVQETQAQKTGSMIDEISMLYAPAPAPAADPFAPNTGYGGSTIGTGTAVRLSTSRILFPVCHSYTYVLIYVVGRCQTVVPSLVADFANRTIVAVSQPQQQQFGGRSQGNSLREQKAPPANSLWSENSNLFDLNNLNSR